MTLRIELRRKGQLVHVATATTAAGLLRILDAAKREGSKATITAACGPERLA
jgi:hypothetical protein